MAKGVDDLIAYYKGAINEVETIVSRSTYNNKDVIYDLVRMQLSNNQDGRGVAIGNYSGNYTGYGGFQGYASYPKRIGDPFNMNASGELFNRFTHKYSNGILIIYNSKADELASKGYSETIAHANEENKIIINNFVTKDLNEWMGNL